ncbi:MFS transporter [Candidatus Symbiopectobacterium sp. 'North America']|uniref:MFS transporter n=1 Tax=Candidatus Symbiopectobacterium sp. 'North America' TaxID=2794574 RepID=UPI0018CAD046|nr:MFS transporter [Candidatus Symbiopectobacterium sp. 'North America']MBG6245338.1 MFS transporter [Candidatus Symbiopectobacterium sp. 'North America']
MSSSVLRQKMALFSLMFLPGFAWSSCITRTPLIRDTQHASTEVFGLILFGFSCGSMVGILWSGKLINKYGIRRVTLADFMLLAIGFLLLAVALLLANQPVAFCALALFGMGLGMIDIGLNIEGAAFEQHIKQVIMTTLHGFFSLGTLVGALIGMGMTALNISINLHFGIIIGLTALTLALQFTHMPWASTLVAEQHSENRSYKAQVIHELKDTRLVLLGVVILAMALAEGSANDWLPLLMIDAHGFSHTSGSLFFVGFAAGMTVGRFAGGYIVNQFGRTAILKFSAVSAAVGLGLIILTHTQWLTALAVILWGIGASLGFPLTISAAGATGENRAVRVTLAAILGYIAFLVGPPALGFIGEHAGLRIAMLPVLCMVILAFFCTSAASEKKAPLKHPA